jgi:hypothetical protein
MADSLSDERDMGHAVVAVARKLILSPMRGDMGHASVSIILYKDTSSGPQADHNTCSADRGCQSISTFLSSSLH